MKFSQERLEECTDEQLNFIECPECGRDDFASSQGVAMHFGQKHDGSISYIFRCEECEELDFGSGQKNTFCSKDCETLSRVGTLKHQDEDFLRQRIEGDGVRAVDVANELGVKPEVVWKWVENYEIGNDFDCPDDDCERSFATSQGVSKHHKNEHGESIRGSTYTCEHCGDENWTPKQPSNSKYPKYCDDDCFGASMEGEDNPNKDPERRKKISESMKQVHEDASGDYGDRDREWMMENVIEERDDEYLYEDNNNIRDGSLISEPEYIGELDTFVRSSWEKEALFILEESELDYKYEPKRFDVGSRTYMPDIVIDDDIVVEVKGYIGDGAKEKASLFMEEHSEYTYIVLGSEIPCDIHVPWDEKEKIVDVVKNIN